MKRWRLRLRLKVSRGEMDVDVTIEHPRSSGHWTGRGLKYVEALKKTDWSLV